MARISKYNFDTDVTQDDFVIGTDSQTKVTKNYKISDILDLFSKDFISRIEELEGQYILSNGEITGLNKSEITYQESDRRADLEFTTNSYAPTQEDVAGELLWYIDFNHNLEKYPSITVTESGSSDQFCIVPVKYIDNNTTRIYFKSKTSGKIYAN